MQYGFLKYVLLKNFSPNIMVCSLHKDQISPWERNFFPLYTDAHFMQSALQESFYKDLPRIRLLQNFLFALTRCRPQTGFTVKNNKEDIKSGTTGTHVNQSDLQINENFPEIMEDYQKRGCKSSDRIFDDKHLIQLC